MARGGHDQRLSGLCHRQTEKNGAGWCDLHFDFLLRAWASRGSGCGGGSFEEEVPVLFPSPTVIRSLLCGEASHKGLGVTEFKGTCFFSFLLFSTSEKFDLQVSPYSHIIRICQLGEKAKGAFWASQQ